MPMRAAPDAGQGGRPDTSVTDACCRCLALLAAQRPDRPSRPWDQSSSNSVYNLRETPLPGRERRCPDPDEIGRRGLGVGEARNSHVRSLSRPLIPIPSGPGRRHTRAYRAPGWERGPPQADGMVSKADATVYSFASSADRPRHLWELKLRSPNADFHFAMGCPSPLRQAPLSRLQAGWLH